MGRINIEDYKAYRRPPASQVLEPRGPPPGNDNDAEQQKRDRIRQFQMSPAYGGGAGRPTRLEMGIAKTMGRVLEPARKPMDIIFNPGRTIRRVGMKYQSMKDNYHSIRIGDRQHQVSRMIDG